MLFSLIYVGVQGAVSEWFKEAVLKTVVPRGTGGSNPPCSETVLVMLICSVAAGKFGIGYHVQADTNVI